MTQDVVYPGECYRCTWEGVFVYIWMVCPEDINEIHLSNVLFKTCISLLIFCFDDLSTGVSGVLKVSYYFSVTLYFSFYVC